MNRHTSISSYYQSSSKPNSLVPFSSDTSSSPSNLLQSQRQPSQQPPHHPAPMQQPPPPPRNQKTDQILQYFYVKVIQIVVLARVTHPDYYTGSNTPRKGSLRGTPLVKKTSKWFNLELEDLDIYKEDAKFWRTIAITESPPAMLVELLLDTSELSSNQMLVLVDENNRKNRVDIAGSSTASTPLGQTRMRRNIILESWSLSLSNTPPEPVPEPPVVYKKSIIFFRSLFAYMRLLPAYQLYRRLRKQNHPLKIGFRVSRGHSPEESIFRDSEIGIEVPLIEGETRPKLAEYRFGQVETSIGAFSLKVTYRCNCEFNVDESEAVLSSRFIDMDENYFTPTVATHSQEPPRLMRQPSLDNPQRRALSSVPLVQRPTSELYSSGTYSDNAVPNFRPRRNSAQSLQMRSGENSSSQSSVSSLGTRMSRRGSSGASGGLIASMDPQNPTGTPPFSLTHGGHALVAKHYVDPIAESPPFKMGASQPDNRRNLSSTFSPFKSPSLSSSPSPSYLEALPSSLSSKPSSIHLNRSPSSSSMHRGQSSQQGSGSLSSIPKSGSILAGNNSGASFSIPNAGANLLSTSAKSNASSTSAPRVTSSFGHRHDSSSRRASSESLPSGRGNRNSIIGSSSPFQLTPDDDDVNAFVQMLAAPEPLKLFGKAGNSSLGPSFTSGDSLSFSTLRNRTALDRFQQLKQSNANLSDSMSASQLITKEQQQAGCSTPLAIATGHLNRQSAVSDMGPNSSSGALFSSSASSNVNRHSQSFSHQPPTPSPLHSEIPVHPQSSSQPLQSRSTAGSNSSGIRRQSWLIGGSSSSVGSASGPQQDNYLKGLNVGSIAFRHGSLDQRRSILDMEEAMDRMTVATPEGIAFGSFPEDVHHQHSLYSAPLDAERDRKSLVANIYPILDLPFGPDPRPIPSHMSGEITNSSRPNRLLRLNNGLNGTGFTLPRLRTRAPDDNEPLNEVNPTDIGSSQRGERDSHGDDDEDEDEEGDIQEIGLRGDRSYKHEANTCINDDDDMLFIMSELSPTSNFGQEPIMTAVGGSHDRAMLPLTGAMLNLRSQSQSPSLGPHGGSSNGGTPSSSSPHLRIFGRNTIGHSGSNVGAAESNNNNSASNRSGSAHHSRVGSSSGSNTNNHNSFENLGLLRRPGSGSGFVDDFNLPSASSTPPPFPGFVAGASIGTFDAVLEGRQMSRGGSERDIGSGANSGGHNSFHSDSRGGRIEGW